MTGKHQKVSALPTGFDVTCPDCGDNISIDMKEQKDGGFEPDPSDAFQECVCGNMIEVIGRWRNMLCPNKQ